MMILTACAAVCGSSADSGEACATLGAANCVATNIVRAWRQQQQQQIHTYGTKYQKGSLQDVGLLQR
jgi:hypothetical protein